MTVSLFIPCLILTGDVFRVSLDFFFFDDVIHYYPRCWLKLSFSCKVRRRGGGGCPHLCGMNTSRGRFPSGHEIVKAA